MRYKLTLMMPEENLKNAKERGKYPLPIGGVTWEQGQSRIVDDLSQFYSGEKAKKEVHEFLLIEALNEDSQETDTE